MTEESESINFSGMLANSETLKTVADRFEVEGDFVRARPYGSGHINDTYLGQWLVAGKPVHYVLQRINHDIFPDIPKLMDNIVRVTSHCRKKLAAVPNGDPDRETLTVIPSRDGLQFVRDPDGCCWRMYIFIERAKAYDICNNIGHAREAAVAVGRFQGFLQDLPGGRLHETIPFFHHTPRRLEALHRAVETGSRQRKDSARDAIEFCMARRSLAASLVGLLESGELPERIAHNDAKFNNVMIDDLTGRAVCVIDLDTVMPGSPLYDFGDMVRTIAQTAEEDEPDVNRAGMDIRAFEALVAGYLDSARSLLVPVEIENLPLASKVITFTIGIRFLTDYLLGDVYFKTSRPAHNLDRARVQFKMVESMERQEGAMRDIVRRHAARVGGSNNGTRQERHIGRATGLSC